MVELPEMEYQASRNIEDLENLSLNYRLQIADSGLTVGDL